VVGVDLIYKILAPLFRLYIKVRRKQLLKANMVALGIVLYMQFVRFGKKVSECG
jgi:hypothetical protein